MFKLSRTAIREPPPSRPPCSPPHFSHRSRRNNRLRRCNPAAGNSLISPLFLLRSPFPFITPPLPLIVAFVFRTTTTEDHQHSSLRPATHHRVRLCHQPSSVGYLFLLPFSFIFVPFYCLFSSIFVADHHLFAQQPPHATAVLSLTASHHLFAGQPPLSFLILGYFLNPKKLNILILFCLFNS